MRWEDSANTSGRWRTTALPVIMAERQREGGVLSVVLAALAALAVVVQGTYKHATCML